MEQTQNPNNQRRVISLLVDNSNGVLARVASLFCRRGFNIDSLTVSATNAPSRPSGWKSPARSLSWTPKRACSASCCF